MPWMAHIARTRHTVKPVTTQPLTPPFQTQLLVDLKASYNVVSTSPYVVLPTKLVLR